MHVRGALLAFATAAVTLGALIFGVAIGLGASPATPYLTERVGAPDRGGEGKWGERMAATNDINGDGTNDLFVGGSIARARVYLLSGDDRSALRVFSGSRSAAFGFFISAPGDLNGDGKGDIAIGAPGTSVGDNPGQGRVHVYSGATGAELYALDQPDLPDDQGGAQANGSFGSRIGRAGDVTGDAVPDVIVGASGNDLPAGCGIEATPPAGCRPNQGQAFIFSGATGALVRTLDIPVADRAPSPCPGGLCGSFGGSVQGPGDTDGDGVADQMVGATNLNGNRGRLYVFSGDENGKLLLRIDPPDTDDPGPIFGFQDAAPLSPGDVNGDGFADLYANGFAQDGPTGIDEGRAWVFNGKSGDLLYRIFDPTPSAFGQFGWSMSRTDYNRDGRPDLYIGQSPHHGRGFLPDENGGTYVFDGRDGSLLRSFELPASDRQTTTLDNTGPNLGWSSAAPGDLDNDGEPDYVAGAPFMDVGSNKDEGRVYVFRSRIAFPRPTPPGSPPAPPTATPPFTGCPSLSAKVIRGTAAANTITGTVGADRIFAGTGNDIVDALAGDDCVDLGTGADRGQGGLGADLLVGGLGRDRISASGGNDRIAGGADGDRMNGGSGNDRVFGDSGSDAMLGGFGDDRLHGVSGNDRISGSRGRDRISGGSGRDSISAGSSSDRVEGDQGSDRITGNSGNDSLKGNSGNDRIKGPSGRDRISGGSGNDRVDSRDGQRDRISCGRGRDTVVADRIDRVARACERVRRG